MTSKTTKKAGRPFSKAHVVKVFISVPPRILTQIDRVAEIEGRNRSDLLRKAFKFYAESNGYDLNVLAEGTPVTD